MSTSLTKKTAVAMTAVAMLALAACGDDAPQEDVTATFPHNEPSSSAPATTQVGSGVGLADQSYVEIDRAQFPDAHPDDANWALTDAVARAFAWKPAEDSTQFDAFRRASSAWNNTYLADNEEKLTTLVPMSSADWELWGERGVQMFPKVTILPDEHPKDTASDQSRVVKIDLYAGEPGLDRDTDELKLSLVTAVRVHKTDDLGWRVDSVTVMDSIFPGGQ